MNREAKIALKIAKNHYEPTNDYDLAVKAIVADICDRGGLKHEWYQIDVDIQEEIMAVWRTILEMVFPVGTGERWGVSV